MLYQIGKAAEKSGLTIETLRHYDRIHLIKPSYTNSDTNYRYYSEEDITVLEVISFFREVGMSLDEIKILLESDDSEFTRHFLTENEEAIKNKIRNLKSNLKTIESLKMRIVEREQVSQKISLFENYYTSSFPERWIFTLPNKYKPSNTTLFNMENILKAEYGFDIFDKVNFYERVGVININDCSNMYIECDLIDELSEFENVIKINKGLFLCTKSSFEELDNKKSELIAFGKEEFKIENALQLETIQFQGILTKYFELQIHIQDL